MKIQFSKISAFVMLAMVALMMTSCSQTYRFAQVMRVEAEASKGLTKDGAFCYEDECCKVQYVFCDDDGDMAFSVTNKTEQILYLDLTKSFLIVNGMAKDYYQDRVWSQSHSHHTTSSSAVRLTAYLAVGGTVRNDNSQSITQGEMPIVAIPPHSSKVISEFQLTDGTYYDCNLERFPSSEASIKLDKETTPLRFTNYLTYQMGEEKDTHTIENTFYVTEITNYSEPRLYDFVEKEKPCQNLTDETTSHYQDKYPVQVYNRVLKIETADKIVVNYKVLSFRKIYDKKNSYFYNEYYDGYTKSNSSQSAAPKPLPAK